MLRFATLTLWVAACQGSPTSSVSYADGAPPGSWAGSSAAADHGAALAGAPARAAAGSGLIYTTDSAGTGAIADVAPAADGGGVGSLSFAVLTVAQGGKYQPKNIGAIWVQDSEGRFVKSLEVWAKQRRKYLTKYNTALGGSSVATDVTASATLSSHRTHQVSWNLQDKNGVNVPTGRYTIVIETTDSDATGNFASVDVDTSRGAQSLVPTGTSYFAAMKLQLQ